MLIRKYIQPHWCRRRAAIQLQRSQFSYHMKKSHFLSSWKKSQWIIPWLSADLLAEEAAWVAMITSYFISTIGVHIIIIPVLHKNLRRVMLLVSLGKSLVLNCCQFYIIKRAGRICCVVVHPLITLSDFKSYDSSLSLWNASLT